MSNCPEYEMSESATAFCYYLTRVQEAVEDLKELYLPQQDKKLAAIVGKLDKAVKETSDYFNSKVE